MSVPAVGHPFKELWGAFDVIFGQARSRTEKSRRADACKDAAEGAYTGEELQAAALHWGNVMGDATMTEHGLVAHIGKLLHGPQADGRNNGTVRRHEQRVVQSALLVADGGVAAVMKGVRRASE